MRKRKLKRTAGQRRYQQLKNKVDYARGQLESLQRRMQDADAKEGRQILRQLVIMQEITEVIGQLKNN